MRRCRRRCRRRERREEAQPKEATSTGRPDVITVGATVHAASPSQRGAVACPPGGARGARRRLDRRRTWPGARHGVKHPVEDFLFTYYSHRPGAAAPLAPGRGRRADRRRPAELGRDYRATPRRRRRSTPRRYARGAATRSRWIRDLLAAHRRAARRTWAASACTSGRWSTGRPRRRYGTTPGRCACRPRRTAAGRRGARRAVQPLRRVPLLHRAGPAAQRAARRPGSRSTSSSSPAACTPTWTSTSGRTSSPRWSPSELVADCFALARDIRALDMRASPYDLAALGYEPVRVETPEGRADVRRRAARPSRTAPGPPRAPARRAGRRGLSRRLRHHRRPQAVAARCLA